MVSNYQIIYFVNYDSDGKYTTFTTCTTTSNRLIYCVKLYENESQSLGPYSIRHFSPFFSFVCYIKLSISNLLGIRLKTL